MKLSPAQIADAKADRAALEMLARAEWEKPSRQAVRHYAARLQKTRGGLLKLLGLR